MSACLMAEWVYIWNSTWSLMRSHFIFSKALWPASNALVDSHECHCGGIPDYLTRVVWPRTPAISSVCIFWINNGNGMRRHASLTALTLSSLKILGNLSSIRICQVGNFWLAPDLIPNLDVHQGMSRIAVIVVKMPDATHIPPRSYNLFSTYCRRKFSAKNK